MRINLQCDLFHMIINNKICLAEEMKDYNTQHDLYELEMYNISLQYTLNFDKRSNLWQSLYTKSVDIYRK